MRAAPALRAIVLAAGRGERMRPLTDHTPKPLLPVLGRPLIEWHLLALARDGVREVVINTAWLEAQFPATLGDGSRFGLTLRYSTEGQDWGGALETAGGIATVLPWLTEGGREAFWVVSADIWAPDFHFDGGFARRFIDSRLQAHLWMVPNPEFHPNGDFAQGEPLPSLSGDAVVGRLSDDPSERQTYANLALMRADLFQGLPAGRRAPLGPLLRTAMAGQQISLQTYVGRWENVGTPAQWQALQTLQNSPHPTPPPPSEKTP
ncbi:MAG: nucleotidyltransferase family protein [Burkholderiales bacterium]|nr:nucleotidyltransferase family protein [Burkholderiales bacterium]MBP6251027.1 nucleotidyltransferase family protein [Leptothrix sp. (in: b-proteobacteria)]MBP7520665.1 nucleotidyltransferase family protein [Leptothrix sp. (in: b-proteobacteria)]HQY10271.1 nucleotidyltransferase family protein [Burkholderiaceae bacterium]